LIAYFDAQPVTLCIAMLDEFVDLAYDRILSFCFVEIEAEEEMQHVNDVRRHQVMMPERDAVSRPKRPVSASSAKSLSIRPPSTDYGQNAHKISIQSNKENVSHLTKLKVC